uniref:Homologous recombination OB-fold protein OB-fold domain-containing protein n=1 Tax=Tanacetum cinerariifolium TaxID=118510 RepID=A0A699HT32_TANCI|nr:hypothetical protein [Tanacetum cinerariifolium]
MDLALQFENSCKAKDDIRNAYEKCSDISQESRALIDTFLKESSDKDYELNLSMNGKAAKLEKQMDAKLAWLLKNTTAAHKPILAMIIPGPAGLVQQSKQLKENIFILDSDGALMSTQEYMQKVVDDVNEDDDFNSGAWISATNYVISTGGTLTECLWDINNFLKKRKLDQVVAIVKSCSPNYFGDLNVTMKDLSCTVRGTVYYKFLDVGSYGKDITVEAPMILANVLSVHNRWVVYRGDSSDPKDIIFSAKQSSLIQFKTSLDVFLGYNEKESVCDYKVKGSWFDRSYTIYAGESTHVVAQMHKKHTVQSIALGKDTFVVTVYPNVDYAFIVALVVILHEINKQKNDVE